MPMLSHLKIAVTTNGLTQVDANFAGAKNVVFYNVSHDSSEFLDIVQFKGGGSKKTGEGKGAGKGGCCAMMDNDDEPTNGVDPLTARVEALKGCAVLFTKGIGDPAAMRVQDQKVFPVKMESVRDIEEVILNMQRMMSNTNPPLWLRRALGYIEQDITCLAED
jgi:nitrogen fixation protein NifX